MALEIDLGNLVIQDWIDYTHHPVQRHLNKVLAGVVVRWDYEYPPNDAASYDRLTAEQHQHIAHEFGRKISNFMAAARFAKRLHEIKAAEKPAKTRAKRKKKHGST